MSNYTKQLFGEELEQYLAERFPHIYGKDSPETDTDPEDEESEPMPETISEDEAYSRYDEMLDECHPEVSVCGFTYSPSHALKELDPIAYRCGFSDYCSDLESEHNIFVE